MAHVLMHRYPYMFIAPIFLVAFLGAVMLAPWMHGAIHSTELCPTTVMMGGICPPVENFARWVLHSIASVQHFSMVTVVSLALLFALVICVALLVRLHVNRVPIRTHPDAFFGVVCARQQFVFWNILLRVPRFFTL